MRMLQLQSGGNTRSRVVLALALLEAFFLLGAVACSERSAPLATARVLNFELRYQRNTAAIRGPLKLSDSMVSPDFML